MLQLHAGADPDAAGRAVPVMHTAVHRHAQAHVTDDSTLQQHLKSLMVAFYYVSAPREGPDLQSCVVMMLIRYPDFQARFFPQVSS